MPSILTSPRQTLRSSFEKLRDLLSEESAQTRDMLDVYSRSLGGHISKDDLKRANAQFADVLRMAGLGTFFVMVPGSMLLIPIVVKAAGKVGVRILPDTFGETTEPEFTSSDAYVAWWQQQHDARTDTRSVVVDALTLDVDPGVFNPCPGESASCQLLLEAMGDVSDATVLDMGTGTGVLAIHAALRGAAHVTAVNVDDVAMGNARRNIHMHELTSSITLVQSDLFTALGDTSFDVILANLPLSEDAWPVEDRGVLARFMHQAPSHLSAGGRAIASMASFGDLAGVESASDQWTQSAHERHFGVDWWTLRYDAQLA